MGTFITASSYLYHHSNEIANRLRLENHKIDVIVSLITKLISGQNLSQNTGNSVS